MPAPDHEYYARAGQIYEWTGDNATALTAYRQALALNPTNQDAVDGIRRLGAER